MSYGTRVEVDEQCNGVAEMTADDGLIPGNCNGSSISDQCHLACHMVTRSSQAAEEDPEGRLETGTWDRVRGSR